VSGVSNKRVALQILEERQQTEKDRSSFCGDGKLSKRTDKLWRVVNESEVRVGRKERDDLKVNANLFQNHEPGSMSRDSSDIHLTTTVSHDHLLVPSTLLILACPESRQYQEDI
jgi:hypothetical protein